MNKYGFYKYLAVAYGAKEDATYSCNVSLQQGSSLADLKTGVVAYDYASLERNKYVTLQPKELAVSGDKFGLLTSAVSDNNGTFTTTPVLTINFTHGFSVDGITIRSRNLFKSITINYYNNSSLIVGETYTNINELTHYYAIDGAVNFNKIVITVNSIQEAGMFLGILDIAYGRMILFEEDKIISAKDNTYYELTSETLNYATLDLKVLYSGEKVLFQRLQTIYKCDKDGNVINKFYLDEANVDKFTNVITIKAYDVMALLDSEWDGMFLFEPANTYLELPVTEVLEHVFSGTNIEYTVSNNVENYQVKGFLPAESRRKTLAKLCAGTGIRITKVNGDLYFDKIASSVTKNIRAGQIVEGSLRVSYIKDLHSLTVIEHSYQRTSETQDFYCWYLTPNITLNQRIDLVKTVPVFGSIKPYVVLNEGEDNESEFPIDTLISVEVALNENYNTSYFVVGRFNTGTYLHHKVRFRAKKAVDNTTNHVKTSGYILDNADYTNKELKDLTLLKTDINSVVNELFNLYSHKMSIKFDTINEYKLGEKVNVQINDINANLYVTKITDTLTGLYEVVLE